MEKSVLRWWRNPEYPKKTTYHWQANCQTLSCCDISVKFSPFGIKRSTKGSNEVSIPSEGFSTDIEVVIIGSWGKLEYPEITTKLWQVNWQTFITQLFAWSEFEPMDSEKRLRQHFRPLYYWGSDNRMSGLRKFYLKFANLSL